LRGKPGEEKRKKSNEMYGKAESQSSSENFRRGGCLALKEAVKQKQKLASAESQPQYAKNPERPIITTI